MTDTELMIQALTCLARVSRLEARGRTWPGPQFEGKRAELRREASRAIRLAKALQTGEKAVK